MLVIDFKLMIEYKLFENQGDSPCLYNLCLHQRKLIGVHCYLFGIRKSKDTCSETYSLLVGWKSVIKLKALREVPSHLVLLYKIN